MDKRFLLKNKVTAKSKLTKFTIKINFDRKTRQSLGHVLPRDENRQFWGPARASI
jgi:hypothetical protein